MEWDVFVSHAHEDKEEIADPLARALISWGLQVWYDKFILTIGDSLRESIDRGLRNSRYGVVILSPNFFNKRWPQQELNGLVSRENSGVKVILPVWHNIGYEQVAEHSVILADRLAANTSDGLETVVEAIAPEKILADSQSSIVVGTINLLNHELVFDGQLLSSDVYGFIKDDRTYIPIIACAVALGINDNNIIIDENTETVTLLKKDRVVQFKNNSPYFFLNGVTVQMDITPFVKKGQMYISPSYVAQALAGNVTFDPLTLTMIFTIYR
jgi:hypothetical protein